jgi:hypothetical protein
MSKPQHASVERGDSRIEGTLVDGLLHGTARVSVTGAPLAVLDGQLDGKAVYYAQDGAVQREAHYERGFLSGESVTYLPNGVVLERATYRRGKLQGVSQRFHPNGQLAEHQSFREGKPLGSAERYASDGRRLGSDGRPEPHWKIWWRSLRGEPSAES